MPVLFVDMDSFYASCEELRHPELKGRAFIVGSGSEQDKTRGVVETASYMAKKAGIRSAMPVTMAMKIKKDVIYVPSDHDYYDATSEKVMDLLKSYKFRTEVMSVDEAALDLEGMGYPEAERFGKSLKEEISDKLGLPCTVGIADGKVLAKIVCDSAKPDGLKAVARSGIVNFLKDKDVERIPGVGPKSAKRLADAGIRTVGDLAAANAARLTDIIGSFGAELHNLANGIDDSKIIDVWKALSIGRERTLEKKNNDMKEVDNTIDALADEVVAELRKKELAYRTITVKAKYVDFTDRIKGTSLTNYTDSDTILKKIAHELIRQLIDEKPFRKVGVRVSSFTEGKGQKKLF